jgi:ketosteroid isomerase-like protein
MSHDHVEAVRGVYERWSQGDFHAGPELYDDKVIFVMNPEFPDAGVYIGPRAIGGYMRGFLEPWSKLTIEATEILPAGDTVFAAVTQCGEGSGSGAATELRYFHLWTFRGTRLIRLEAIRERDDALTAAGLEGSEW